MIFYSSLTNNLTNYTLGSYIDLASYSSSDNAYTFPSDGYLLLDNDASHTGRAYLNTMRVGAQCTISGMTSSIAIPVRKGMTFYTMSTFNRAWFYPFE